MVIRCATQSRQQREQQQLEDTLQSAEQHSKEGTNNDFVAVGQLAMSLGQKLDILEMKGVMIHFPVDENEPLSKTHQLHVIFSTGSKSRLTANTGPFLMV